MTVRSWSGFLPVATGRELGQREVRLLVSIPQWVFSPSRLLVCHQPNTSFVCFNPAVGFLPVATQPAVAVEQLHLVSIPQWVFSPSRPVRNLQPVDRAEVSIPQWVFSPSQLFECFANGVALEVSIPQWVFSPSRPGTRRPLRRPARSFNPAVGFLPVATTTTPKGKNWVYEFQSRSGFSPRRDHAGPECPAAQTGQVSIPQWVFSPSRQVLRDLVVVHPAPFQSRSGFSPRRDRITPRNTAVVSRVSIPQWVFSPSRQGGHFAAYYL